METRQALIARIDGFLTRTGMSERQFGLKVNNDHKFVGRLKSGAGITLTVIEKAERVLREHVEPPPPDSRPCDSEPPPAEAAG